MKLSKVIFLIAFVFGILNFACEFSPTPEMIEQHKININKTLDDWHKAAAAADFELYFSFFDSDMSVYMGTDATERWLLDDFKKYSKPHFDAGKAWSFVPVERHIRLSKDTYYAWFDERLDTPNLGPARGTGVLVLKNKEWKITHYNLSIPIPNAIMGDVKKQIEKELNK